MTPHDKQIENMILKGADFALAFKDKAAPRWITVMGITGTGKTHLCNRLWRNLSAGVDWAGTSFIQHSVYWPKFVSELRGGNSYDKLRDMMSWPVLFLDDIGAERDTTGFASEQLNTLLGCRVGRWTILTSNLLLNQLGEIDPRIADRIIRRPNIFVEVNTTSHALRTL